MAKRTPKEMAEAILFATEEANRLLGDLLGTEGLFTDSAVVAGVMLDLLKACEMFEHYYEAGHLNEFGGLRAAVRAAVEKANTAT